MNLFKLILCKQHVWLTSLQFLVVMGKIHSKWLFMKSALIYFQLDMTMDVLREPDTSLPLRPADTFSFRS